MKNLLAGKLLFWNLLTCQTLSATEIYQCNRDYNIASVTIIHERPKGELPCRVMFSPPFGEQQTLWRVQFERGLCAKKAARKRNILEAQGWRCQASEYGSAARPRETLPLPNEKRCRSDAHARTQPCSNQDVDVPKSKVRSNLEQLLANTRPQEAITLSLVESVTLALRNSRDIESGYLGRIRDRLALEFAEDEFWPDLTIEGGPDWTNDDGAVGSLSSTLRQRLPTGGDVAFGWANDITGESGRTRLSGEVIQPLWGGAGVDANLAGLRQARLDYESGDLTFRGQVIDLVTEVVTSHRALILAEASFQVATRSLERAIEQKRINEKLLKAGRIARFEAVQSDANIANREVDLASAQLDLEDSRRRLLSLLDIETEATLIAEDAATLADVSIEVDDALDLAFRYRPDYLGAELTRQSTKVSLAGARSEERFGVDLVAGIDHDNTLFSDRRFDSPADTSYRAGLRLNIPFGDVARDQAVKRARLDIRESEISFEETRSSIYIEITSLIANIDTTRRRVDLAERAEKLAKDQLDAEQMKYARGLSSTLDVITLEDALIDTQLGTLEARITYSNTLTELDRAMGMTLATWDIQLQR